MNLVKLNGQFSLSAGTEGAVAQILPATIVTEGKEIELAPCCAGGNLP